MLVALQVELSEEPRGADGDERRAGGVRPEVRREPVEGGPGEVVRDDEGIRVDKQRVLLQDVRNVLQHHPTPREPAERTRRTKRPNETKVAGVRGGEGRGGRGRTLTSAVLSTLSLSSASQRDVSTALGRPTLSTSRKKLFPTSSGATSCGSRMVKWPMPGRTRFFSVEVAVAVPPITSRRADSSAAWPVAAQSLFAVAGPWLDYIRSISLRRVVIGREDAGDRAGRGAYRNWRSYFCVFASGGPLMHPISIYLSHTHHEQYARLHRNRHPCEWQTALGSKCYHYRKRLPRRRTARLHDQERKTSHFIHDYKVSKPISNM